MTNRAPLPAVDTHLAPLPMEADVWRTVCDSLKLSPQQTRIVELILRGCQDKEIAAQLGVSFPTVRTYLKRIFDRLDAPDRVGVILRVFALSQQVVAERCRHS